MGVSSVIQLTFYATVSFDHQKGLYPVMILTYKSATISGTCYDVKRSSQISFYRLKQWQTVSCSHAKLSSRSYTCRGREKFAAEKDFLFSSESTRTIASEVISPTFCPLKKLYDSICMESIFLVNKSIKSYRHYNSSFRLKGCRSLT